MNRTGGWIAAAAVSLSLITASVALATGVTARHADAAKAVPVQPSPRAQTEETALRQLVAEANSLNTATADARRSLLSSTMSMQAARARIAAQRAQVAAEQRQLAARAAALSADGVTLQRQSASLQAERAALAAGSGLSVRTTPSRNGGGGDDH